MSLFCKFIDLASGQGPHTAQQWSNKGVIRFDPTEAWELKMQNF